MGNKKDLILEEVLEGRNCEIDKKVIEEKGTGSNIGDYQKAIYTRFYTFSEHELYDLVAKIREEYEGKEAKERVLEFIDEEFIVSMTKKELRQKVNDLIKIQRGVEK